MHKVEFIDQVIYLEGKLSFCNVMQVRRSIRPYLEKIKYDASQDKTSSKLIKVDLAKISHVDSAALVLFCAIVRYAKIYHLNYEFVNAPAQLLGMAKLSGVCKTLRLQ